MVKATRRPIFARPPRNFRLRRLKVVRVSGEWLRIHHHTVGAIYFSKAAASRWDAKSGLGAMCVGETLAGIVLERFGDQLRANGSFLTAQEITDFCVTRLRIDPALTVADIRDRELFQVGADAQLFSGPYAISQQWSLAFMKHPARVDGLLYNSRHDPKRSNLVLFNRPHVAQQIHEVQRWALRDFPSFTKTLGFLRLGVSPVPVKPIDPP